MRLVRDEAGYTLFELLVVMAILGVVLVGMTASFAAGLTAESGTVKRVIAQENARLALNRMRVDVHCASAAPAPQENPFGGFTLTLTESPNVCPSVTTSSSGVQWCTIPVAGETNRWRLFRFLGTVLAIFLTHAVVRGDAERGLLQPLVVRPVGRAALLAGRFGAAALVCTAYVILVYTASLLITHWVTGWWPDRIFLPAVELATSIAVIVAISLFGSIVLSAIANGIAIFMVFGAGLVAGLLGQIGEALSSDSLNTIANVASWALPFEALYQDALNGITADTEGFTKAALSLGPFGGAQPAGLWLWPYVVGYMAVLGLIGAWVFNRKDL